MYIEYSYGPKWPYYSCDWIYCIYWTVWDRYLQVLYLGRAPRTKETLPDFPEVVSGNPTSTRVPRVDE